MKRFLSVKIMDIHCRDGLNSLPARAVLRPFTRIEQRLKLVVLPSFHLKQRHPVAKFGIFLPVRCHVYALIRVAYRMFSIHLFILYTRLSGVNSSSVSRQIGIFMVLGWLVYGVKLKSFGSKVFAFIILCILFDGRRTRV